MTPSCRCICGGDRRSIILKAKAVKADAPGSIETTGVLSISQQCSAADRRLILPSSTRGAPERFAVSYSPTASLMHLFSGKLGALPTPSHALRLLRRIAPKGGADRECAAAQIFVHFYGEWSAEMEKSPVSRRACLAFCARAAHLYHRHTSTTSGDEWITEGSRQAFAAMALRADASAYVQSVETCARKCRSF